MGKAIISFQISTDSAHNVILLSWLSLHYSSNMMNTCCVIIHTRWKDVVPNWSKLIFITDSCISEKMFTTLTCLKFEKIFSSFNCLPTREIGATFALSAKNPLEILLFIASANGWESTIVNKFASLGGLLWVLAICLLSISFSNFRIWGVVTLLN